MKLWVGCTSSNLVIPLRVLCDSIPSRLGSHCNGTSALCKNQRRTESAQVMVPPSKQPQLGSLAIQAPEHPQIVHVSPSTCHDLSLFKGNTIRAFGFSSYMSQFLLLEILREYRRLDDTITMRLNRANATMRDQERMRDSTGRGNVQEQACLSMWRELVGEFLQV